MTSSVPTEISDSRNSRKEIRVWMDGCFDMLHCSHAVALCRAKQLGDTLQVGLQSDASITAVKGRPVFNETERYSLMRGIKWVDQVHEDVPYGTTIELLDAFNCDFCAHGDDPTIVANSKDVLHKLKEVNRMRFFPRGNGCSTSGLIDRILESSQQTEKDEICETTRTDCGESKMLAKVDYTELDDKTKTLLARFSGGKQPAPGDTVVYVPGTFSIFHIGHQEFLEKAASLGNFLLVGIYKDHIAKRYKGPPHPVMTMTERALRVLACKCVSNILMDAPYGINQGIIDKFQINIVCHGETQIPVDCKGCDPFSVAKELSMFQTINSGNTLRSNDVIERITKRRNEYEERSKRKKEKNTAGDALVQNVGNNLIAETAHIGRPVTEI